MLTDHNKMKLLEDLYKRDEGGYKNEDFVAEVERLTQHHIRQRALKCRWCQRDIADLKVVYGYVHDAQYDDGVWRPEYYNFCSAEHMTAFKSWE